MIRQTEHTQPAKGSQGQMVICRKGSAAAVCASKPCWKLWDGKVVKHINGSRFIATSPRMLDRRVGIYKSILMDNPKTKCPYPMVIGHSMFWDSKGSPYVEVPI